MSAIDQLLASNPFEFNAENRRLFVESFRECADIHFAGSPVFRAFWQEAGLLPQDIKDERDLERVPPIMVNLFKEHEFVTGSRDDVVLNLTSSGTSGQKSQILLDQSSLDRVKRLAWQIHKVLGITSDDAVNYLCFTYDPRVAMNLGTAFTDELLTSFTKKKNVSYAIKWSEDRQDFFLDIEGVMQTLQDFVADGAPVRILGFPAHLYKILKDRDVYLQLPPHSWVQTGGGWKGFVNEEVPKEKFRGFVADRLGIPDSHIRDMFGMVEHGIPYCDCPKGRLHIPNYARVFMRSPRDLKIVPEGEVGLMHLMCSYLTSYPSVSLLTTDWGRIGSCDCEIGGKTLEILGRAGVQKHKGCALQASKLLDAAGA